MTNEFFKSALQNAAPETGVFVRYAFDIADRIHFLMEKKQLSGLDLAKKLRKNPSEISRYLSGTHNFTLHTLAKLEWALGESIIHISVHDEIASTKTQPLFDLEVLPHAQSDYRTLAAI